jgi:hypothetical protein
MKKGGTSYGFGKYLEDLRRICPCHWKYVFTNNNPLVIYHYFSFHNLIIYSNPLYCQPLLGGLLRRRSSPQEVSPSVGKIKNPTPPRKNCGRAGYIEIGY